MAEPHALLADRYRLVRQVGRGGMGVVWEAWDERLERPVAVKQLKPQLGLSPEEAELAKNRAMREARITARLHHRNAVPVFDAVEHEGQPCLIMQFLPSVPLSRELRESGPLGVPEAARVGAEVGSALAAAHQLGIVHRDVKPGNILITDDGTALLSDFGISRTLGDATLTSTGLVHGTPAYLAPEVARGAESSFASDVFSLGATLYTALEGAPPFGTDPNSIALLYRVASGEFSPPQRAAALAPVLMDMLRSDPARRPAMKEAAARLAAVQTGNAGPAPTLLLAPAPGLDDSGESTETTQVRDSPPIVAAAPTVAAAAPTTGAESAGARPTAAPPGVRPPSSPAPPPGATPRRRRRGAWVLGAVALLVGVVVLGVALGTGGFGGTGTAADPATTRASSAPASSASSAGPDTSGSPSRSSSEPSSSPSPSARSSSPSPTPSPTPSSSAGAPTAAELEQAIRTYYSLVPDETDEAWPLLTASYQSGTSGGRKPYERFWNDVDRVSLSKIEATPPSRVDAIVTYRYKSGNKTAVERTSFRLVRDDGILKINSSSVLGAG